MAAPARTASEAIAQDEAGDDVQLPAIEFDPPPAIESPAGRRGRTDIAIDVTDVGTPQSQVSSRESRDSMLPTPQTVKVNRLGQRLDAADEALKRRKERFGSMSPVSITADDDEWQARIAAIDANRSASPASVSSSGSPKWSRDTAPTVVSAAMESALKLPEEKAEAARRPSPVSSGRTTEPPFIAGSTTIAQAPSRGAASPNLSGGESRLTDQERRARRERREKKRLAKEAANTKRLLAARQAAKQMDAESRKLKAELRLARRRGMALTHIGGGGHYAPPPAAMNGANFPGSSGSLFGTARTGAPKAHLLYRTGHSLGLKQKDRSDCVGGAGSAVSRSFDGSIFSHDSKVNSFSIPVGGAIPVRNTRRSEGTHAIGLSKSLDVLLPSQSYQAAVERRPESLSPIQRRVRAQNSRALSVPPLGLDSTLDSINEKRSGAGVSWSNGPCTVRLLYQSGSRQLHCCRR